MTKDEFWTMVQELGARLYDPSYMRAVLLVAEMLRNGEHVEREELPWPLS